MRVEVTCDESGSEGENLIGGNTDSLAHAGVRIPLDEAEQQMAQLRDRIRSPATEYAANHLQRPKHRHTLEWFLGPDGPVHGRSYVFLTENVYFLVGRLLEVLVADRPPCLNVSPFEDAEVAAGSLALLSRAPPIFGAALWQTFLTDANALLRIRD